MKQHLTGEKPTVGSPFYLKHDVRATPVGTDNGMEFCWLGLQGRKVVPRGEKVSELRPASCWGQAGWRFSVSCVPDGIPGIMADEVWSPEDPR